MSVDVDWEYEDITLERVCSSTLPWLCISLVRRLAAWPLPFHLHVIMVGRSGRRHTSPEAIDRPCAAGRLIHPLRERERERERVVVIVSP